MRRIFTVLSVVAALGLALLGLIFTSASSQAAHGNLVGARAFASAVSNLTMSWTAADAKAHRYHIDPDAFGKDTSPFYTPRTSSNPNVVINEAVQTQDVFEPSPLFQPYIYTVTVANPPPPTTYTGPFDFQTVAGGPVINQEPQWTSDDRWIIYSSNRPSTVSSDPPGNFHLWAVPRGGVVPAGTGTTPSSAVQLTYGAGNEFYPSISPSTTKIAYVNNAAVGATVYVIPFNSASPATVDADTQKPATVPNIALPYINPGRPTWSPSESIIVFAATDTTYNGHPSHLFYLYTATGGSNPNSGSISTPGLFTTGPQNDIDPAWSPDGNYIAFASNATSFQSGSFGTTAAAGANPSASTQAICVLTASDLVPSSLAGTNGLLTNTGNVNGGPAWCNPQNAGNALAGFAGYIAFHRQYTTTNTRIVYFAAESINTTALTTESGAGEVTTLNTSDPTNTYENMYPTWAPLSSVPDIAAESNRSVVYNSPLNNNPSETPISVSGQGIVPAGYVGILESELVQINPPTILETATNEYVHLNQGTNNSPATSDVTTTPTQYAIPGQSVTLTVRLSDRESGLDNNRIFLQVKDPTSEPENGVSEHKIFANEQTGTSLANLFNGAGTGDLVNQITTGTTSAYYPYPGAVSGWSGASPITLGRVTNPPNNVNLNMDLSNPKVPLVVPGINPGEQGNSTWNNFYGWGQEVDCQAIDYNAYSAGSSPAAGNYETPFYTAGIDDQSPHTAPSSFPASQYIQMTPVAAQDTNGGVLYSCTFNVPANGMDFYLNVVGVDTAGNWRIYDNIWGFNSQPFTSGHDVLVVSDYALGQKFAAAFTNQGAGSDLLPMFYGTESYYTAIDPSLLPNAVYINTVVTQEYTPGVSVPVSNSKMNLTGWSEGAETCLQWTADGNAPYQVYRNGLPIGSSVWTNLHPIYFDNVTNSGGTALTVGSTYTYSVKDSGGGASNGLTVVATSPTSEPISPATAPPVHGEVFYLEDPMHNLGLDDLGNDGTENDLPLNALGTGQNYSQTYFSPAINDNPGGTPSSEQYDIWRVLSRGPVPSSVLMSYAPVAVTQPPTEFGDSSATFYNATKCVLWLTPYNLRLVKGPGTFASIGTQKPLISNFLGAGGRLMVTGTDLATAMDNLGGGTAYLNSLGASAVQSNVGSLVGVGTIANAPDVNDVAGRISTDAFWNYNPSDEIFPVQHLSYYEPTYVSQAIGYQYVYEPPSITPDLFADDAVDAFSFVNANAEWAASREDGQVEQFHQWIRGVGNNSGDGFIGNIDSVTPGGTGLTTHGNDFTYANNSGLVYSENTGTGARVVFAAFGLENFGWDAYVYADPQSTQNYYMVHNKRAEILHNVLTYLRSATFTGTVSLPSGAPADHATVYLNPTAGASGSTTVPGMPAGRTHYSALTDASGNYSIEGVDPGSYMVSAYGPGFNVVSSHGWYTVEADTTASVSLQLEQPETGTISGSVLNSDGTPATGATITYTAEDGTVLNAVAGILGAFSISPAPAAPGQGEAYTGIAQFQLASEQTGSGAAPSPTVFAGGSYTDNFVLQPTPANTAVTPNVPASPYVSGLVTDGTNGIGGATVTAYPPPTALWSGSGVSYSTGELVAYNGNEYNCLIGGTSTATSDPVDADAAAVVADKPLPWQFLGTAAVIPWTLGASYTVGELVSYAGSDYQCLIANASNNVCTSVATWSPNDVTYTVGELVQYTVGANAYPTEYRTIEANTSSATSNPPPASPSLFTFVAPCVDDPADANAAAALGSSAAPWLLIGSVASPANSIVTVQTTTTANATSTNPVGSYALSVLASDIWSISVISANHFQPASVVEPAPGNAIGQYFMNDGQAITGVNFVAPAIPTGTLSGTVTDSVSGLGIPATLTLIPTSGPASEPGQPGTQTPITLTANSSGSYTSASLPGGLLEGTYSLTASDSPGYTASAPVSITIAPSQPASQNFSLSPLSGTLVITVTDSLTQQPITNASVVVNPASNAYAGAASTSGTTTDGVLTISGLLEAGTANPYTISVSATGYGSKSTTSPVFPGQSTPVAIQLNAKPLTTLSGLVTDATTGLPISGVTITIQQTGVSLTTTASTGANYSVANIPQGTYTLTFDGSALGYPTANNVPLNPVSVAVTTGAGQVTTQNVTLSIGTGGLTGTITDAITKQPIVGANVNVTGTNSIGTPIALTFPTNASGVYQDATMPDGNYSATVSYAGYQLGTIPSFPITQGVTATENLALQPVDELTGSATGWYFFSAPYDYAAATTPAVTFTTLLGSASVADDVYQYEPLSLSYSLNGALANESPELGEGYWVYLTNPVEINQQQEPLPTSTSVAVTLNPGWNMIGVPNISPVPVNNLTFTLGQGTPPISFGNASEGGSAFIRGTLYGYNGAVSTNYQTVVAGGSLNPWQAYWIYTSEAATLNIPTGI